MRRVSHGEPGTDSRDRTGFSLAKEILGKQGYEVGTLSLLTQTAVPDTASILAIAGPRKPMTTEELDRIQMYVEKGGHLLVMVDPESQAELNPLLRHWGAGLGPGVLVDFQDRLAQGEPTVLLVRTFTEHVGPTLSLLSHYVPGFEVTWTGAAIGCLDVGVMGFGLGYLGAWMRNEGIKAYAMFERWRAERHDRRRLLDKV